MIYPLNATSVSLDVFICDDTGLAVTGLVAATMPTLTWSLAGANADVAFPSLTDLGTLTTAWSAGGVKERGNGYYRLDVANAMFTTAGVVTVRGEASSKHVIVPRIEVAVQVASVVGAVGSVAAAVTLPSIPNNWLTAAGIASGALNGKGDWLLASNYTAPDNTDIATLITQVGVLFNTRIPGVIQPQTGDAFARIGANGAGLTAVGLASNGLDAIVIETGLNARQALSINAAALAGVLAVSGTTVTIAAAGVPATNRITTTVDASGQRISVTLHPPA